jgi:hypothetical protein
MLLSRKKKAVDADVQEEQDKKSARSKSAEEAQESSATALKSKGWSKQHIDSCNYYTIIFR